MFKHLVLASTLALSACLNAPGGVLQPVEASSATHITLVGADALSKASDAYAGVSIIAAEVVRHGLLDHNQLLMLRTLNDHAIRLIDGADTTLTITQRAASLFLVVTQIHSIVGR